MFYHFNQNNSGGRWQIDGKLCHHVIIEAANATEANGLAEELGIYFNGVEDGCDCECCGDRWHSVWGQGKAEPLIYVDHPATYNDCFAEPGEVFCRVFYLDGRVAEFRKPAPFLIAGE